MLMAVCHGLACALLTVRVCVCARAFVCVASPCLRLALWRLHFSTSNWIFAVVVVVVVCGYYCCCLARFLIIIIIFMLTFFFLFCFLFIVVYVATVVVTCRSYFICLSIYTVFYFLFCFLLFCSLLCFCVFKQRSALRRQHPLQNAPFIVISISL